MRTLRYLSWALALFIIVSPADAAETDFKTWLKAFKAEARREGISQQLLDEALPNTMTPIERVLELDRKQPEGTTAFADYLARIVDQTRIEKGKTRFLNNRNLLNAVGEAYGVDPQVIVALWGVETNYGQNSGSHDVAHALATLAYDGRRGPYFRQELLKALKILNEGHVPLSRMKGSWAGAMGQVQFMPSSFYNFAQDYNKDGRRDIWGTEADVFASAANYLAQSGWKKNEPWGREVKLPAGFNRNLLGLDSSYSLKFWKDRGVLSSDGSDVPFEGVHQASIIQPDGPGTPAFLIYDNYRVIMKWNRSNYFATSVGLLADSIASR